MLAEVMVESRHVFADVRNMWTAGVSNSRTTDAEQASLMRMWLL